MFVRIPNAFLFSFLLCLTLPLWVGCSSKGGAAGSGGQGGTAKPEVIVDSVGRDDVQIYIYTEGRTMPSNSVEIRSRVSGYLEQLFFEPGAIVRKGDRLALVEQASYQIALRTAQAELASAKAQAFLAESNLGRAKRLLESGTITTEEFQIQQSNCDVAFAAVERANAAVENAELNLQYTDMRAPITGKTTKNLVDIGNFVSPTGLQSILLSIGQFDPMFVEFKLSDRQFTDLKDRIGLRNVFHEAVNNASDTDVQTEEELTGLPLALVGMPVDVSLMTGVNVFSFNFDIPGKVVALVDDRINFATAQTTLRAEVRNPLLRTESAEDYMIYPGKVCRVRIPYEKVQNAVLIREGAILTDLDTKYVLLVTRGMYHPRDPYGRPLMGPDGKEIPPYETDIVVRRDIKLGRLLDTQMRIVASGLEPGETYIVHGVQRVRIGSEVQPTTLEEYDRRRAAEVESIRATR